MNCVAVRKEKLQDESSLPFTKGMPVWLWDEFVDP